MSSVKSESEPLAGSGYMNPYDYHNFSDKKSLQEADRLLGTALHNYKTAVGYGLMKYKLTSDALELALWDMDILDGDPLSSKNRLTYSQEFRNMLGYADENDFPNVLSSWSDRLHPDDKERALNALKSHLNDYSGKTIFDVTYRMRMKNGKYRYFQAFGTTMRSPAGAPICVAGALADITEKKQTQEQLETIWNRVESGIVIIDAETRELLVVNPAAASMFGSGMETMLGKKCNEVFCTTERCPIMELNQEIDRSERIFRRANGEKIAVIKSVSKI
ncbi:MAG: PAS domain-containing protein, partial [Candidatus Adiutrix sp.]|nr:PAS domain-containing protein [Candidatus Adiutrix sp.]